MPFDGSEDDLEDELAEDELVDDFAEDGDEDDDADEDDEALYLDDEDEIFSSEEAAMLESDPEDGHDIALEAVPFDGSEDEIEDALAEDEDDLENDEDDEDGLEDDEALYLQEDELEDALAEDEDDLEDDEDGLEDVEALYLQEDEGEGDEVLVEDEDEWDSDSDDEEDVVLIEGDSSDSITLQQVDEKLELAVDLGVAGDAADQNVVDPNEVDAGEADPELGATALAKDVVIETALSKPLDMSDVDKDKVVDLAGEYAGEGGEQPTKDAGSVADVEIEAKLKEAVDLGVAGDVEDENIVDPNEEDAGDIAVSDAIVGDAETNIDDTQGEAGQKTTLLPLWVTLGVVGSLLVIVAGALVLFRHRLRQGGAFTDPLAYERVAV